MANNNDQNPYVDVDPEISGEELENSGISDNNFNAPMPKVGGAVGNFAKGFGDAHAAGANSNPSSDIARGVRKQPANKAPSNNLEKESNLNNGKVKQDDGLKNNLPKKDNGLNKKGDLNNNSNPATGVAKPNKENSDNKNGGLGSNSSADKKPDNSPFSKIGNRLSNLPFVSKSRNLLSKVGLGGKEGLPENDDNENEDNGENTTSVSQGTMAPGISIGKFRISIPVLSLFAIVLFILFLLIMFSVLFTVFEDDDEENNCNGLTYGSSDATEFLKSMQSPFGDASYTVTSFYGWRFHPIENIIKFHAGVDVVGNGSTDIYAVQDGKVESIQSTDNGGYGINVVINHNDTFYTRYAHLSSIDASLTKGTAEDIEIKAGQKIGVEGETGAANGVHLHFELMDKDKKTISPNAFFGYSDQGYEECVDESKTPSSTIASNCMMESSASARKLGDDGFVQVSQKTNSYSNSDCCTSYSSSVSGDSVDGLPTILTQEFVNGAIQSQSEYGVPASLILAQIMQESSGSYPGNLSGLAYDCKNLFGIKGTGSQGSCKFSTTEYYNSSASTVYASFAKYSSYLDSIKGHGELLSGDYYRKCTKDASTADDWARAIKKCGYATDPNYAENLIKHMKQYDLYRYDDVSVFGSGTNQCESTVGGSGGSTDIVKRALEEYEKWNKVSSDERTEMLKNYMQACGLGRTCNDWCAGFVSYILQETGKLSEIKGYNCMAKSYSNVSAKDGSSVTVTHHKLSSGYTPQPGDIIVYGNRHVGLVEKVEGKTVHTIEGNTSGQKSATCWSRSVGKHAYSLGSQGMTEFVTIS